MSYVSRAPPGVYGIKPAEINPYQIGKVPVKMKMQKQTPCGMANSTGSAKFMPQGHSQKATKKFG